MSLRGRAVAVVHAAPDPRRFLPTLASLRAMAPDLEVVVSAPDGTEPPVGEGVVQTLVAPSLAAAIAQVRAGGDHRAILAVSSPVLLPDDPLGPALDLVEADLRVASVGFWSNSAWLQSFPYRAHSTPVPFEGFDERSLTRRLRQGGGAAVPVPLAMGPAVLLAPAVLGAVGPPPRCGRFADALALHSARTRTRGFIDVLEPTTFLTRSLDLHAPEGEPWDAAPDLGLLLGHHPEFRDLIDSEARDEESALGLALAAARSRCVGLEIVIDGRCLGPREMGTQVQTLSVIDALARREDVRRVGVALGDEIPGYARAVLAAPRVDPRRVRGDALEAFSGADVVHRPYQPDGPLALRAWREVGRRSLVTVQDLIAFHIGRYHAGPDVWVQYREAMRTTCREADGIVVVSADTAAQIARERLPVDASRVFVVPNGTDHLTGAEEARMPAELAARGWAADRFVLILGVNYAHKNRDLGVAAWRLLRPRWPGLHLVVAGAPAPAGSSRIDETVAARGDDGFEVLPDVSSEERNWLLRHASVLLYPSSAEGFGLVPYEAARNGTPTVVVGFGPLAEVVGDLPAAAADWSPENLAAVLEQLLVDPDLARRQVAAARAAEGRYSWRRTAELLVGAYRDVLARPRTAPG